jgi:hypothetical protein
MKILSELRFCVLIAVAVLNFAGCNEDYKSTTKINTDGSCERIILVKADSAFIHNGFFHVPADKSWDPQLKSAGKDTQKVFIVKKSFNNVNDINDEYKKRNKAGVEINFEKKFRWFFTYYSYNETYKAYNPFNRIPLVSFLTKDEYSRYEKGDTSAALKKRMDEYFKEDLFEYFYEGLKSAAGRMNDKSFTPAMLDLKKKELHDILTSDNADEKEIAKYISRVSHSDSAGMIESVVNQIMNEINGKLESTDVRYQFTNEIIMPGIVLNTNADALEGNKGIWKFSPDRFRCINYTMAIESRTSNQWAVYATGGIVLIVIFLLLLPRLKRK